MVLKLANMGSPPAVLSIDGTLNTRIQLGAIALYLGVRGQANERTYLISLGELF